MSYDDVLAGKADVGRSVAIMWARGIGYDVAEPVTHSGTSAAFDPDVLAREWGNDFKNHQRSGMTGVEPVVGSSGRKAILLQRKAIGTASLCNGAVCI